MGESVATPTAARKVLGTDFGPAEWFGEDILNMTPQRAGVLVDEAFKPLPEISCPFKVSFEATMPGVLKKGVGCSKKGGVCSLRSWGKTTDEAVNPGAFVATCPHRFLQDAVVVRAAARDFLRNEPYSVLPEFGLMKAGSTEQEAGEYEVDDHSDRSMLSVGRVDFLACNNEPNNDGDMRACVIEKQSVYFSGNSMEQEFELIRRCAEEWEAGYAATWPPPFMGGRRPDFRSSTKRLLPQLIAKSPMLGRMGCRLVVCVDKAFFDSLGKMEKTPFSASDVFWFVADIAETGNTYNSLSVSRKIGTTMDEAIRGLTAAIPLSRHEFNAGMIRGVQALKAVLHARSAPLLDERS